MQKKNICLALLLSLSLYTMGQDCFKKYYEYKDSVISATYQLNMAIRQHDTTSADVHWKTYYHYFQKMDSIFPIESGSELPNYYYAAEHFSDTSTAKRLLFRMAEIKWCDMTYLNSLRNIFHLDKRDYWDSLMSIVRVRPCRNETYIALLDTMTKEDQQLRQMLDSVEIDKDSLLFQISTTDSLHIARMKELIRMYGFPTYSVVGYEGNRNASLLAQHGGPEFLAWYLPLARIAADSGDYCLDWLAYMIDRERTFIGLPQLYGSQLISFGMEEQYYFEPIADMDHLQERRNQVGLGDILTYCEYYGLDSVIVHPTYYDYTNYYQTKAMAYTALAMGDTTAAIRWLDKNDRTLYPFMRDMQLKYCLLVSTLQDSLAAECYNRMLRCGYIPSDSTSAMTRRFMADYQEQQNKAWSEELRNSLTSAETFISFLHEDRPRYSTEAWENPATMEELKKILLSLSGEEAKRLLALLRHQVTKGNLHPEDYAHLYDATYYHTHGKSYYGTLKGIEIHRYKKVDKRREEIGLPPLWVYIKLHDI